MKNVEKEQRARERLEALAQLEDWMEMPMVVLGFIWLVLLVLELTRGLHPVLAAMSFVIWGAFIVDFLLEFILAPRKLRYLARNWLTTLALFVPALRVFRIFRAVRALRTARAVRGIRLVRVLASINRGMGVLGRTLRRRGFGYAVALTLIVTFTGAAGMYAFEYALSDGRGLHSYGTALWWTAMIMTTMGSEYWPQTPEGRFLCLLLAIYTFAVFGYVTATLASFFVNQDAQAADAELAGADALEALRREVAALRADIRATPHAPAGQQEPGGIPPG